MTERIHEIANKFVTELEIEHVKELYADYEKSLESGEEDQKREAHYNLRKEVWRLKEQYKFDEEEVLISWMEQERRNGKRKTGNG